MLPSSTWKNNDVFRWAQKGAALRAFLRKAEGILSKRGGAKPPRCAQTTKTAARRFFICLTQYDSTPGRVRFSSVEKNLSILLEKVQAYSEKNAL